MRALHEDTTYVQESLLFPCVHAHNRDGRLCHQVTHSDTAVPGTRRVHVGCVVAALTAASPPASAEEEDPPEAPVWYSADEASAWRSGWSARERGAR